MLVSISLFFFNCWKLDVFFIFLFLEKNFCGTNFFFKKMISTFWHLSHADNLQW
jgi:hypothetical protein